MRRVTRPQIAEELALAGVIRIGDQIDTAFELDGPLLLEPLGEHGSGSPSPGLGGEQQFL